MKWANRFNTKTFEAFMTVLFKSWSDRSMQFFNKKIVRNLGDKTAEIVLSTRGTHGQYDGLKVSIIHKDNGPITSEWFGFAEYLAKGHEGDSTHPFPNVLAHCGADWYMNGPTPNQVKIMVGKIKAYVQLYVT